MTDLTARCDVCFAPLELGVCTVEPLHTNPIAALPVVTEPVTLTENQIVKLARELAYDMQNKATILKAYKLTQSQFASIEVMPYFRRTLEASVIEWEAATNTPERVRLKAAVALEEALPTLGARMQSKDEDLNKAVEAAKLFAKVAGIGERAAEAGTGEKITISINLGNNEKIVLEQAIAPSVAAEEIPQNREGQGDATPLRAEPEGARDAAPLHLDPPTPRTEPKE